MSSELKEMIQIDIDSTINKLQRLLPNDEVAIVTVGLLAAASYLLNGQSVPVQQPMPQQRNLIKEMAGPLKPIATHNAENLLNDIRAQHNGVVDRIDGDFQVDEAHRNEMCTICQQPLSEHHLDTKFPIKYGNYPVVACDLVRVYLHFEHHQNGST